MGPGDPHAELPAPKDAFERWFLRGFVLLIFGGFAADAFVHYTPVHLSILFFLLSWVILTVVHELGHAVAARIAGWQVVRFVIGVGPTWRQFRVRGTWVELRAIPLGGFVLPLPQSADWGRTKNALVYVAGPAAELMAAGVLVAALGLDQMLAVSQHAGVIAAQAFCVAAAWGAITNLLPFRAANGAVSDGLGFLLSPFLTPEDFAARQLAPELQAIELLLHDRQFEAALAIADKLSEIHPEVLILHFAVAEALVSLDRRLEAMLRLQSLFAHHPKERKRIEAMLAHVRPR
jgi:hypothetical protein